MRLRRHLWAGVLAMLAFAGVALAALTHSLDLGSALFRLGVALTIAQLVILAARSRRFRPPPALTFKRLAIQCLVVVSFGAIVSSLYWFGMTSTYLNISDAFVEYWPRLDYVPSLFASLFVPDRWQSGLHEYFRPGITYCFPGPYWWETRRYLRTAIAAYAIAAFLVIQVVDWVWVQVPKHG